MSNLITLHFADGSLLNIDRGQWPALASTEFGTIRPDGQTTGHLIIGRHGDGRALVYVIVDLPTGDTIAAGEIVAAPDRDVESAVWRIAERFSVPSRLAQACLDQYREARLARGNPGRPATRVQSQ
jgi:hypothetical protein